MKNKTTKAIILFAIIAFTIAKAAYTVYSRKTPIKEDPKELAATAVILTQVYATNPDSLALGIKLLDRAIELAPDSLYLYEGKAQILCLQKKYKEALALLNDTERKYKTTWSIQFHQATILDYIGDSISAKLSYERGIDYCDYQLEKVDPNSVEYENLFIARLTAKLLRYGKSENTKNDIEALKTWKSYYEESYIYYTVIGFENFDKKKYIKSIMAPDEENIKGTKASIEHLFELELESSATGSRKKVKLNP